AHRGLALSTQSLCVAIRVAIAQTRSPGRRMMETTNVYVLMTLSMGSRGDVVRKNIGVTLSLHEAEAHQDKDIGNEFETFQIDDDWSEDVETSNWVVAMREFRDTVRVMQEEALR